MRQTGGDLNRKLLPPRVYAICGRVSLTSPDDLRLLATTGPIRCSTSPAKAPYSFSA
jgi:hypothetical protein